MTALISISEQQTIKPISLNWANFVKVKDGKTNYEQIVEEVQIKDLTKLLGNALLYDIENDVENPIYEDLLNGKSFVCGSDTLAFRGIKFQLAYLVFGQYAIESHVADTFTGLVQKNRTESQPINLGEIKTLQNNAREIAMTDFEIMSKYLTQNSSIYPLWKCSNVRKPYNPIITGLKKTIK